MEKHARKKRRFDKRLIPFLLPSLVGLTVFFIAPFILSARYAFTDSLLNKAYVGLENFTNLLGNVVFTTALKNTLLFIAICVPLNVAISFLLASALRKTGRWQRLIAPIFLLPLVIPSGAVVYLWDCIFRPEGLLNKFLLVFGHVPVNWAESAAIMPIIVLIFLWKNVGYNVILFWAGLNLIPGEYYESAKVEGAGAFQQFRHVTLIYAMPTSFLVLLMSIVNSFKSFKEIYLLFGTHPSSRVYMLQHYVNNQFMSMNMSNMTVASYILAIFISLIVVVLFRAQKKLSDSFS